MPKKNNEPQPLQLATLSGTFEAARTVISLIPIYKIGTYDQLSKELVRLSKNKDLLKILHGALDKLDAHSQHLGATTLVKPADHPLIIRKEFVPKNGQDI